MPNKESGFFKINRHDSRTVSWWYSMRESIDMSPPYQRRGRLWSKSDKAYLIDSILNGFDVPKLYLADFQYRDTPLNNSKKQYAIIDGKQRFEAIFDFFDGNVVLNQDFVFRRDPTMKLGNLSLRDLEGSYPKVADTFRQANWDVVSVISDNENDINDLFVRLNRSKPLTGAEIRNAMTGPIPDMIRGVAKHPFFKDNIRFSTSRAQDINAATKILLFEYSSKPAGTKKADLDKFAQNPTPEKALLDLSFYNCLATLDTMSEVFLPRDALLSSAGVFPVYYWLVRNAFDEQLPYLREFLVVFEEARKRNRRLQNEDSLKVDSELSTYDRYNRSTDDAASHRQRHEILSRRLKTFLL